MASKNVKYICTAFRTIDTAEWLGTLCKDDDNAKKNIV